MSLFITAVVSTGICVIIHWRKPASIYLNEGAVIGGVVDQWPSTALTHGRKSHTPTITLVRLL